MDTITSRHHPLVGRCRALAAGRGAPDADLLLDGPHLVREALRSGLRIEVALVASGDATTPDHEVAHLVRDLQHAGVEIAAVGERVLAAASPVRTPSGVVAIAAPPRWLDDALLAPAPALVVGGVDIQDPGNLGAVIRAAEAFGATGIVVAGASADPFGWKALRGAMGSSFRLPTRRTLEVGDAMTELAGAGLRLLAAVAGAGTPLEAIDLTDPVAILLGSEGRGLPEAVVRRADARVSIPMRPPVDSLNVAVAAGVIAFEARRQRQQCGATPKA